MTMVPIDISAIDRYLEGLWERGGTDLHITAGRSARSCGSTASSGR